MAGDWIKMREDLHEDPAILFIANRLETRPEHVVGYCHKFWSWVSRQCYAGIVTGVRLDAVEGVLSLPGFAHLLCEVGWLEYDESGPKPTITIPKFDRHLSQGAKNRALAAERVRNARVAKPLRSKRNKSVTREEKRREDKGDTPLNPTLPPVLDTEQFRSALDRWLTYKRERRENYRPSGMAALIRAAEARAKIFGVDAVVNAIDTAMANTWQGWNQPSLFGDRNGSARARVGEGQRYQGD